MSDNGMWIKNATRNVGGLHRSLGIPEGKNIPESAKVAASHSKNPKVKKQGVLALTLEKLRNKKK